LTRKPGDWSKPQRRWIAFIKGNKETMMAGEAKTTTDHEEIRRWVEERGGKPACVKGTGSKGNPGMLRIDYPGYSGEETLQEISWDEFFEAFEANRLAFLYQEETRSGAESRFSKLISRDSQASEKRNEA
jgi:hypothetical protein